MRRYSKRGEGAKQKMFSFRLDEELICKLNQIENKGRLINTLLRWYLEEGGDKYLNKNEDR